MCRSAADGLAGCQARGAGLARAAAAAGLTVIECEQRTRRARCGKGKSDPIGAHLAVLTALRLDLSRLPIRRAGGDRGALRILLCARQDLTTTATAQANRLRALLRDGGDQDRALARSRLSGTTLATLARRRQSPGASRAQAVRHGEIGRLALALRDVCRALMANRAGLDTIVNDMGPGAAPATATAFRVNVLT